MSTSRKSPARKTHLFFVITDQGWNSEGGIVLRAIQAHGAPRPILQRLHVTGSYIRRMPSFPAGVKKTQFVWFDENQGKFNVSNMVDVVLADNTFDVPGLDVLSARATRARRSVRVANQTLLRLDFSDQLLYGWDPGAMLASVQTPSNCDYSSSRL